MSLSVKELPHDQYERLPVPITPNSIVMILEDDETKEVKGFWVAAGVVHVEPVWLAPDVRGSVYAVKLLQHLLARLAENGDPMFYAFSETPEIEDYLGRLGLTPLPYKVWFGVNPLLKDK